MAKLEWNVYRNDFNMDEIEKINILSYANFREKVEELALKTSRKKEFSEEVRKIAMYYFWAKCEYELVITSWPPYVSKEEINRLSEKTDDVKYRTNVELCTAKKISIYDQLLLNWNHFIDYLWDYFYYNRDTGEESEEEEEF